MRSGFGGDGSTASANAPLPGLEMAMKQYSDQVLLSWQHLLLL